ncbi:hypothetical protein KIL84_023278, partial [Mauremys mutica]
MANLTSTLQQNSQSTARACRQLTGHILPCTFVTPHARLHLQCLQASLMSVYTPTNTFFP